MTAGEPQGPSIHQSSCHCSFNTGEEMSNSICSELSIPKVLVGVYWLQTPV